MKTNTFILLLLTAAILRLEAQTNTALYGLVRKNFYSSVGILLDSTNSAMNLDSTQIKLGRLEPNSGAVVSIGNSPLNQTPSLSGAALDPYKNTYTFIGGIGINTLDVATGNIINQIPINYPDTDSYFDNIRFNNSDSTVYGLLRRINSDSTISATLSEIYLAKINSQTGVISKISSSSVAQGFSYSGSAIDPYQMVYYFSVGSNLVGLDIYNGSIHSNVPITISGGTIFDNFTYSCADTGLYGLIRQNYFTTIADSTLLGDSTQILDSTTIKLGRINPNTGIVTIISPHTILQGGYSITAGAAVDPNTMTYYFGSGSNLMGVSLITGLITSNVSYAFEQGVYLGAQEDYFDLIRNFENCYTASPTRLQAILDIEQPAETSSFDIFPNPASHYVSVSCSQPIQSITISTVEGRLVNTSNVNSKQVTLPLNDFTNGLYFIKLTTQNNHVITKKMIKN